MDMGPKTAGRALSCLEKGCTNMEIGKNIQQLRREKGLTQEQTAGALGVTSAAVSKWETGAAVPDVALLCPLARLLGTTVDGLLGFRPALEKKEIDMLLERGRQLFEAGEPEEAAAFCEGLLREYPDDLYLKCAAAGLYIVYMTAVPEQEWIERQSRRAAALLEPCREGPDPATAARARSMLVNLYVMQEDLDRALAVLDELPAPELPAEMMKANILLRKGELEEAERLYQAGLWAAAREASLNLAGLSNAARSRRDFPAAMERVEAALALERVLHTEELGGLSASLRMMRSELLRLEGRLDEAMEDLTGYVEQSMALWERLKEPEKVKSPFYDRLSLSGVRMSAAYLAKNILLVLEQSEELAPLREREDFQNLLAKLRDAGQAEQ